MPRYLKEMHHIQFEKSELVSGLPLFFGGISCLVGGTVSDLVVRRLRRKWLGRALFPICGYSIAAAAMLCLPLARTADQVAILLCVAGAGGDFGQAANWASIVDIGGRYAGTATGFINTVGNAGNFLGPSIGVIIFHALGWNFLMVVYAGSFLAAASMWLFINPERTFYTDRHVGPEPLPGGIGGPALGPVPSAADKEVGIKERLHDNIKPR
jgi:MFS family permease